MINNDKLNLVEATKIALQGKLVEEKKISLYSGGGTPYALSNFIDDVPMFKEEIEDAEREQYKETINNYQRFGETVELYDETQNAVIFKITDSLDNVQFLKIVDDMGSEEQGKSKRVTCTSKSGVACSLAYAGITSQDEQEFVKEINKANKEDYVSIASKYSSDTISLDREIAGKTSLKAVDSLGNIHFINIRE